MNTPKTAIVLDKRRPLKDGKYPVKLRVTHNRKQQYYATKYSFSEEEYNKVTGDKPRGKFKEAQLYLYALEVKADRIISKMHRFSFPAFEHALEGPKKTASDDLFEAFAANIEKLFAEGRVGTAESYRNALRSLQRYAKRKKLEFERITPEWLHGYEARMLQEGKSISTVGIYLRYVRALFNGAIEGGIIGREAYPFGKRKYRIPASRNVKQALSMPTIAKIFKYEAEEGGTEQFCRDLWVFSYLCNGVNIADIARLKYGNISGERITFIRSKTARTSREDLKPVVAVMTEEAGQVIDRWGSPNREPGQFIFPILKPGMSPEREKAVIKQQTKSVNKHMRNILKKLGIDEYISTKAARHSFSTTLKQSGASIEFISESLGHHDLKTTELYLASFNDDIKKRFAEQLTNFSKNGD